jgi:general secretion pathway protein G
MLVVIAIIALLAGLVGPAVMDRLGGAKTKTAGIQIADLDKALEIFKLDVGRYPTNAEGLQALVAKPASANGWNGPYLKGGLPADPWGNPTTTPTPAPTAASKSCRWAPTTPPAARARTSTCATSSKSRPGH